MSFKTKIYYRPPAARYRDLLRFIHLRFIHTGCGALRCSVFRYATKTTQHVAWCRTATHCSAPQRVRCESTFRLYRKTARWSEEKTMGAQRERDRLDGRPIRDVWATSCSRLSSIIHHRVVDATSAAQPRTNCQFGNWARPSACAARTPFITATRAPHRHADRWTVKRHSSDRERSVTPAPAAINRP